MTRAAILSFTDEYRFLSNFWYSRIRLPGIVFPRQVITSLCPFLTHEHVFRTAEHAFQAMKMAHVTGFAAVLHANHPAEAKRTARTHAMRSGWDDIRLTVMRVVVAEKFAQNLTLAQQLRDTGDADLIEGNTWHDVFWGRCVCQQHRGMGENHLGQILMSVRAGLGHTDRR